MTAREKQRFPDYMLLGIWKEVIHFVLTHQHTNILREIQMRNETSFNRAQTTACLQMKNEEKYDILPVLSRWLL